MGSDSLVQVAIAQLEFGVFQMENVSVSLKVIPNGFGKPFGVLMVDELPVVEKTKPLEFGMLKLVPVSIPCKDILVEFGGYASVPMVKL
jgi:hypothetical protein